VERVGDFSTKIPLIGVGPARTASTWLYQVIADTRLVECASTKELSFFDQHYDKQLAWYRQQFTNTGRNYWIDITPQYINSSHYCERISDNFPNAYIFVGIRDPIERIRSLFKLLYYNTRSTRADDYENYLQEELSGQILIASRVAFLSRAYRDRFVVIRYEDLKRDPVACAKQVLSRCGIVAPLPVVCNHVVNSLYTPKNPRLTGIGQSLFRSARKVAPALAWGAKPMAERLLTQKILLERFLGEEALERIVGPYRAKIEEDNGMVEEIIKQMSCGG
jgi:hypothetical protein